MRKPFLFVTAVSMLLASAAIAQPTAPSTIKPTQSPVVPGKVAPSAATQSSQADVYRANPLTAPAPNPLPRDEGGGAAFRAKETFNTKPNQGAPLSSQVPSTSQQPPAHGAISSQNNVKPYAATPAPTELGKGSQVSPGGAVSPPKVTPSKPPLSQTQTGPRPTGSGDGLQGDGGNDRLSAGRTANSPNPFGSGKDSLTYERRPNPSIQPITPAPSPATQAGQQGKR